MKVTIIEVATNKDIDALIRKGLLKEMPRYTKIGILILTNM